MNAFIDARSTWEYSERKYIRYREYSQYIFRDCVLRIVSYWSTRTISGFTSTVLYSACGILLNFKYFRDLYCGYFQVLAVFRPVGTASTDTASTASTRSSTKLLSICAVYWEYEGYFDHISVHRRFNNFIRILLQTAFTDGPTDGSWSKLLSGGELEYLEYWQYFGSICCEHSKYLRVQRSWYSEYSNHFGCLYCGYCLLYSGFCTAHHTPSTRSIWAFSTRTAHAPTTRSI